MNVSPKANLVHLAASMAGRAKKPVRSLVVVSLLAMAEGALAAAPTTITELVNGISFADATAAVILGAAAIIAFKVVYEGALILIAMVKKAH